MSEQKQGLAQQPSDREEVAKVFAHIWHGDAAEWRGFLTKADAFLTYPGFRIPAEGELPRDRAFEAYRAAMQRKVDRLEALVEDANKALVLAEDILSRAPFSTGIWPNGMHPQRGIDIIRAAITSTVLPSGVMAAAAKAAEVVEGWSDSKKEYAGRISGASNPPQVRGSE